MPSLAGGTGALAFEEVGRGGSDLHLRCVVAMPGRKPTVGRAVLVGTPAVHVGSTRLAPAEVLWVDCCPTIRQALSRAFYPVLSEADSRWPEGLDVL